MLDYVLEFRSIDPSRRYSEEKEREHKFVMGMNRSGLQNVPSTLDITDLPKYESNHGKAKFLIKPYQRGFRWDATDNVKKLLEDLFEYSESHSMLFEKTRINYLKTFDDDEFDFYCLQTLTVRNEGPDTWEVIDGQQRLTCVFLIYMMLSSFSSGQTATPYDIIYQREGESFSFSDKIKEYLDSLSKSEVQPRDILSNEEFDALKKTEWFKQYRDGISKCFDNESDLTGSYAIDSYYIRSAMLEILNFIESGKDQQNIKTLIECVKRNVYFLWYLVPESNGISSEEIFLKINSGAIPLTNAELIKSLVLRKDLNLSANSRKWESIERGLSESELWSFVAGTYSSDTRIDLLLEIFANNNGMIVDASENNPYALFDWYNEYKKQNADEFSINVISGIQDIFDRICEWYDDVQIYHYVGLLSVMFRLGFRFSESYKNQQEMIKLLLSEAESSSGKNAFIATLKSYVQACLEDKLKKSSLPEKISFLVDNTELYNNDFLNYSDDSKRIEAILWMVNILEAINSADNKAEVSKSTYVFKDVICRRFPFSEALSGAWSLEHIFPQHPDEKDKALLKEYNENVADLAIDNRLSEDDVHSIKNLALLKRATNTSLQNEMLWKKRSKLIDEIGKGAFVPSSTVNAFMLYYNTLTESEIADDSDTNWKYWTAYNAEKYESYIVSCLKNFDTVKEV